MKMTLRAIVARHPELDNPRHVLSPLVEGEWDLGASFEYKRKGGECIAYKDDVYIETFGDAPPTVLLGTEAEDAIKRHKANPT